MFPEEISSWIGELSKADCPPKCRCTSYNPLRAWIEQRGRGRLNLPFAWLLELGHQFFPALCAPDSQAFRLRLEPTPSALWLSGLWTTLLAFLGPQFADVGLLSLHNHMSQYPVSLSLSVCMFFCISFSYWFYFFGDPLTNTSDFIRTYNFEGGALWDWSYLPRRGTL